MDDASQYQLICASEYDRDHDPEAKKDGKDDAASENGDHMTYLPTNNHVQPHKEDQDSEKSDDNEDLTRGPIVYEREKTNVISEDSEDSRYS